MQIISFGPDHMFLYWLGYGDVDLIGAQRNTSSYYCIFIFTGALYILIFTYLALIIVYKPNVKNVLLCYRLNGFYIMHWRPMKFDQWNSKYVNFCEHYTLFKVTGVDKMWLKGAITCTITMMTSEIRMAGNWTWSYLFLNSNLLPSIFLMARFSIRC